MPYSYQRAMSDADARRFAPASARNREPILAVLAQFVREGARVLEIASGSGEHATFLAERLPIASWQPTDPDQDSRASIDAWTAHLDAKHVLPAIDLDVTRRPWPISSADVVVCINMIHIAPWSACLGLLDGASDVLPDGGLLYLYGPFRRGGELAAPSNVAFDDSLRSRHPEWGVRDLEVVTEEGIKRGFSLGEVAAMPANNLSVVLRRSRP